MIRSTMVVLTLSAFAFAGCKKSDPPEEKKEVQAAKTEVAKQEEPPVVTTELSPDSPETKVEGIPTPEDFEDEAEKAISADNLEAELDRLEAEISGEEES